MTTHSNSGEVTLSRTLGLLDITMIGVGAMIGAGIFVLTGIAAGFAGPALTIAFLANGIVTTFTALSYAELGSSFPEAGGGYLWVKQGMSGTQGFLAGWMSWFAHAVASVTIFFINCIIRNAAYSPQLNRIMRIYSRICCRPSNLYHHPQSLGWIVRFGSPSL